MNARTDSYKRYGLHAIRDLDQKAAWINHLQGKTVRLYDLPTNGDHCTEQTHGGLCGFPLLIDATCPNAPEHWAHESPVTDVMVDAAFDYFDQIGCSQLDIIGYDDMRCAIEAALRAQETEQ